jgi:hypothetical protein
VSELGGIGVSPPFQVVSPNLIRLNGYSGETVESSKPVKAKRAFIDIQISARNVATMSQVGITTEQVRKAFDASFSRFISIRTLNPGTKKWT